MAKAISLRKAHAYGKHAEAPQDEECPQEEEAPRGDPTFEAVPQQEASVPAKVTAGINGPGEHSALPIWAQFPQEPAQQDNQEAGRGKKEDALPHGSCR